MEWLFLWKTILTQHIALNAPYVCETLHWQHFTEVDAGRSWNERRMEEALLEAVKGLWLE